MKAVFYPNSGNVGNCVSDNLQPFKSIMPGPSDGRGENEAGGLPPGSHDGGSGQQPGYEGIVGFLGRNAPYGAIVNKILVWLDLQMDTTTDKILQAQALARFTYSEFVQAKTLLWECVGPDIVGDILVRSRQNKESLSLNDLVVAMTKLKDVGKMPLLLSSSIMMRNTPAYNCDISEVGPADIMQRVRVLENGLSGFMKEQNEKIMNLTDLVGAIGAGSSSTASTASPRVSKLL